MAESGSWREVVAGPDVDAAAKVWANSLAPAAILADPPRRVLEYLSAHPGLLLAEVLDNAAVPRAVKSRLAGMVKGQGRAFVRDHALYDQDSVSLWLAVAPALTPSALAGGMRFLVRSGDWRYSGARAAEGRERLAKVLKAFASSADPRCRALVAQAADLTAGRRHEFAQGLLSAPRLAADPDVAVRCGLARNYSIRRLPQDEAGLKVRRTLLEDPAPRVRTAARRAGLHVTESVVAFFVHAVAEGRPGDLPPIEALAGDVLDDTSPHVRATAVAPGGIMPEDTQRWAQVAADPSPHVRAAAATNGLSAPQFVWAQLAGDADARVRTAVARSHWAPADALRRLQSDADPGVAAIARARDPLPGPAQA